MGQIFVVKIANYIASGDEYTELPHNQGKVRNVIKFKFDKYECQLNILPEVIGFDSRRLYKQKGKFIESGHIFIKGISSKDEGEQVSTDICRLLSLATMSKVVWYSYSYGNERRSKSTSGFYNSSRPLLDYERPNLIQVFLQQCWKPYQENRDSRNLFEVIEYLLQCERPNQPLEIKLVFASIILESLKSTYAHTRDYRFDGSGLLTKEPSNENLKCDDKTKCKNRYMSFRALLKEMLFQEQIDVDLTEIIKLRNEVFHNGLSSKDYEHMNATYKYAQDVIREYLLRLLGYKGEYYLYSKNCRLVQKYDKKWWKG